MCRLLWVNMVELSWVSLYGQQQRDSAIAAAVSEPGGAELAGKTKQAGLCAGCCG